MQGFLTQDQKAELLNELKVERNEKLSVQIKVILLLDKGWTHERIAEALLLDDGTIRNYRKRYIGLVTGIHSGKRSRLI